MIIWALDICAFSTRIESSPELGSAPTLTGNSKFSRISSPENLSSACFGVKTSFVDVRVLNDGCVYSKDSMGNTEVLRRGDIQMTSAGTGIRHSEKCHGPKQVHFLQIWASPNESNLPPKYYTRSASSFLFHIPPPHDPKNLPYCGID